MNLDKFDQLRIFENDKMLIYSPNIKKAGGTIFIYYYKIDKQIVLIDAGIGVDETIYSNRKKYDAKHERIRLSETDKLIFELIEKLSEGKNKQIYGFLTHGHLDHIFGIVLLAKKFNIKWYGSETTVEMIKKIVYTKEEKEKIKNNENVLNIEVIVKDIGEIDIGSIKVKYFPVVHSIPEALAYILTTKNNDFHGLHLSEFRTKACSLCAHVEQLMFQSIIEGRKKKKYDVILYDVLRQEEGITESEDVIVEVVEKILQDERFDPTGALVVPYISSKIWYSAWLQILANKYNAKFITIGKAIETMVRYAQSRGWINEQIDKNKRFERLIISCTGSQAEPDSALMRAIDFSANAKMSLMPVDWLFVAQGTIPQYIEQVSKMYKKTLKIVDKLLISEADARVLKIDKKHPKVIIVDEYLGKKFVTSSGHGRIGDHNLVLDAATGKGEFAGQVLGYQSVQNEYFEGSEENNFRNMILEDLKKDLLELYPE